MKALLCQINTKTCDLKNNTKKIIENIKIAKEKKIDIVVFPELSICGYHPEDMVFHENFIDEIEKELENIKIASKNITVIVGFIRRNLNKEEKHLFNSAAIIQDGKMLGFQDKLLIPTYDVFNEKRYFEPGKSIKLFDICGKKTAVVICEDIWQHSGYLTYGRYKRDPILEIKKQNPELLITISASPYQFEKPNFRIKTSIAASKTLKCPVIMCCMTGANGQLIFDGHSTFINKDAKLCKIAKSFKEDNIEINLNEQHKEITFNYNSEQNLLNALILGVSDYFKKQNFKTACIGISGGIDSALTAYIATKALGHQNVYGMIMPTRYSKKESEKDAKNLINNLKINSITIPIEPIFCKILDTLTPIFKDKEEDKTEENIQARIRSTILMAISNKFNHIVLSTGNKSEIAVGYATLYGDMCGGLGVIADVLKTQIYKLCKYINKDTEIIPKNILLKPPSAELRENQKDSDDLPSYETIDSILKEYIENYSSKKDISKNTNIPIQTVEDIIIKIHKAEYKRRQGPPILRVSKKSFGVGRHFPINCCFHD